MPLCPCFCSLPRDNCLISFIQHLLYSQPTPWLYAFIPALLYSMYEAMPYCTLCMTHCPCFCSLPRDDFAPCLHSSPAVHEQDTTRVSRISDVCVCYYLRLLLSAFCVCYYLCLWLSAVCVSYYLCLLLSAVCISYYLCLLLSAVCVSYTLCLLLSAVCICYYLCLILSVSVSVLYYLCLQLSVSVLVTVCYLCLLLSAFYSLVFAVFLTIITHLAFIPVKK
jgi:hypothetical protein